MTATDAELLARLEHRPDLHCRGWACLAGRPQAFALAVACNPCGCVASWWVCQECADRLARCILPAVTWWRCWECERKWYGPSFTTLQGIAGLLP